MKKVSMRALVRADDLLGVDLGTHSVKVLQLRASGKRLAVVGCAQKEVWRELDAAKTPEAQREVYARAVRELAGAQLFRVKTAALSLPGNAVLVRFVDVTNKKRMDARTGLPEDALATIPFDPQDAVISARARPAGGAPGREELALVFARREAVTDGLRVLADAGLTPSLAVNDALAAADAAYFLLGAGGTRVVVNIGASTTSVVVSERGLTRAVRVLNIAGGAFTRAVRREFGLDLDAAEAMKKKHGLAGNSEEAARVRKALRPLVRDLCAEIRRTIDGFLDKRPQDHPALEAVLVAGGSADMPGLVEEMSADLELPVEVLRPFVHAHVSPGLRGVDKNSSAFTVAAGLSLSGVLSADASHEKFNLLPRGLWRAALVNQMSTRTVVMAVAVGVLTAALGYETYLIKRRNLSDEEKHFEYSLAVARRDMRLAHERVKPAAKVKAKEAASPFQYLRSLQVSGVFGAGNFVMLTGGERVFAMRSGRLYDENEKEVAGVSTRVESGFVVLTTSRGDAYRIALPK